MVSISSNNSTAVMLLQPGEQTSSATGFLISSSFSASSNDIFNAIFGAFSSSRDLQRQFADAFNKATANGVAGDGSRIHPDNAKHIALLDTIIANREAFPPEEFAIHTELPDGASITTVIPSAASIKAETFRAQMAEKQASYEAAIAAKDAAPDPEAVKLNAMSQIVKSLILDSGEPVDGKQDGEALYKILAREY